MRAYVQSQRVAVRGQPSLCRLRETRKTCPPCKTATTETRVATVEVDVGTAVERISVPLTTEGSRLVKAELRFPLGLVFESKQTVPSLRSRNAGIIRPC